MAHQNDDEQQYRCHQHGEVNGDTVGRSKIVGFAKE